MAVLGQIWVKLYMEAMRYHMVADSLSADVIGLAVIQCCSNMETCFYTDTRLFPGAVHFTFLPFPVIMTWGNFNKMEQPTWWAAAVRVWYIENVTGVGLGKYSKTEKKLFQDWKVYCLLERLLWIFSKDGNLSVDGNFPPLETYM